MSIDLRRRSVLSPHQITVLEQQLAEFYRHPPPEYYRIADESAGAYDPQERPFHCDLVQRVSAGMSVLELGCGTAHLCPYVQRQRGTYTGVDYSAELIAGNRRKFPAARFLQVGEPLAERFDLVASLYAIEHVVDPPAYLQRLWDLCRPGGLIGIICPEFLEGGGLPPSVYYGRTPRRLRHKLQQARLFDAVRHVWELKVTARTWSRRLRAGAPGSFWINLRPRVLCGGGYVVDGDAVHVAGRRDLVWYFRERGAEILQTAENFGNVHLDVRRFNCYVLVRKPNG